jgi:hypothetical protein
VIRWVAACAISAAVGAAAMLLAIILTEDEE